MTGIIIQNLKKHIELGAEQESLIQKYLKSFSCKKGALLLQKGDVSDKTYYVVSGILREYFLTENGHEVTIQIANAGRFIYSSNSYFLEIPAESFIEVIENANLIAIHKSNAELLFDAIPALYKFVSKVHQRSLLDSNKRHLITSVKNTKERIDLFRNYFPDLEGRVSQKVIASFINIKPQTLSKYTNN